MPSLDPERQLLQQLEADAWPWPMSQDAQRHHDLIEAHIERREQRFNHEEHRRFMRSL
ncbi:hypothetical protein [Paraburkholderia caribensis]|uniref:hypothetical protein n=1 Tax=Paraburkholderia caribensis TaxID=75105 RepID=UPI001D076E39|nr:hypothetical protein [Paraburkholderia caribensis]